MELSAKVLWPLFPLLLLVVVVCLTAALTHVVRRKMDRGTGGDSGRYRTALSAHVVTRTEGREGYLSPAATPADKQERAGFPPDGWEGRAWIPGDAPRMTKGEGVTVA